MEHTGVASGEHEALGGLVHRFIAEAIGAKMHGDEGLRLEFVEGLHGLFGAHVDVAEGGRFVGADGEKRDFGGEAAADLAEAGEVGGVAAVIDLAAFEFDGDAAAGSTSFFPSRGSKPRPERSRRIVDQFCLGQRQPN